MSANQTEAIVFPSVFMINCSDRAVRSLSFHPLHEVIFGSLPRVIQLSKNNMVPLAWNDPYIRSTTFEDLLHELDKWAISIGLAQEGDFVADWRDTAQVVVVGTELAASSAQIRKVVKDLFPNAAFYRAEDAGFINRRHPIWELAEIALPKDGFRPTLIEELDLSVRTYNLLRRERLLTVESLTAVTEEELDARPDIGISTIRNIQEALGEHDLALRTPSRVCIR